MRRTRRILLLAIFVIVFGVATTYYIQKQIQIGGAVTLPSKAPLGITANADGWVWSKNEGSRPIVEVRARSFQQLKDPNRVELEKVELRLFHKDGKEFDLVTSEKADFNESRLYSDGEVEITMGVPADGSPKGRLLKIHSSGVSFDAATGKAVTERAASFVFDSGEGQATGAEYDPATRELRLKSEVQLRWGVNGPQARMMIVESGELIYREQESVVHLSPWSRLTRGTMTLEAGPAVVTLQDGVIRQVNAEDARGSDKYPGRSIDYAAKHLLMELTDKGEIRKIEGHENARLASHSLSGQTSVASDRVDLTFAAANGESLLEQAQAFGKAVVESKPAVRPGVPTPSSRVLKSEIVLLKMRPGGQEIEQVETHAPGRLEFIPNHPGDRRRQIDGERMWITYGAQNQIRAFRAVNVATRTEPLPPQPGAKAGPDAVPALTWSKDMQAEFDPKTSQLQRLEQWDGFRYQEGPRQATATRALMESERNVITLKGKARVWDAGGAVAAEQIVLNQKSGDFTAEGGVNSTRLPERKDATGTLLSGEEPLHARAARMFARDDNMHIVYEGGAVLWQGGNRVQGDRIEIDRKKQQLVARGNVVSQFAEPAAAGKRKQQAAAYTMVYAPRLLFTNQDRLAHYTGGARLVRAGMNVKAEEIRAFLREDKEGTSLDKAYADQGVEILQREGKRTRKGSAEHAEYYVAEDKVVLHGGDPTLVDSVTGSTRGTRLTYYSENDRLVVDGAGSKPAVSKIKRGKS